MRATSFSVFMEQERPSAVLLDAYGVFWAGSQGPYPGAAAAMQEIKAQGAIVGVLSNATAPSAEEENKLARHGLKKGVHYDFYLTSGEVARTWLKETLLHNREKITYFSLGFPHPQHHAWHETLCAEAGIQKAQTLEHAHYVIPHVPHCDGEDTDSVEMFREILAPAVKKNLPMICLNPDQHVMNPDGALVVRQGAIGRIYEEQGGKTLYLGKPFPEVYAAAMRKFHELGIQTPEEVWMIGDTPETDIRGAKSFGMKSALVVETGVFQSRCHKGWKVEISRLEDCDLPDRIIESIVLDK